MKKKLCLIFEIFRGNYPRWYSLMSNYKGWGERESKSTGGLVKFV